ncbi:MAG: putative DNA binding domain-containing protein [Flavobacteriaceae bacterium]|jgi:ATP-dependent DNA helicase RecG|nr:putative DNA binding domain-containing protein [Flavobacteriaceae bacterium]
MPETQNIEYKSSWRDEFLREICGFANAQGGKIYIGKDDGGNTVDVKDYKKLMDEIPNKTKNLMGVSVEVNLHEELKKHFIEIVTPPYSVPISLRGRYYYRSGSVNQELTGTALNEFLLKKSGFTWDEIIETDATFDDIDEKSVKAYLVMAKDKGRLPDVEGLTTEEIFNKLRLTKNGKLKRAAIILFGKDPRKFYLNAFAKIGRFGKSDADLRFQEVQEGNIIVLLREVLEQLNQKFLIRNIQFEGFFRVEKGEYPTLALREMLLNALIHRNYMGSFIQIRVYDDKINIWNSGVLPEEISLESLRYLHPSIPRNSLIADVCFKGGLIDAWGSGTVRIIETCVEAGLPEPELIERDGGFLITLFKNNSEELRNDFGMISERFRNDFGKEVVETLDFICKNPEYSAEQLAKLAKKSSRTIENHIAKLKNAGIIYRKGAKLGGRWEINLDE